MIAIVDYGVGNLFSVKSSFSYIGAEAIVTGDEDQIRRADKILLPGVGAFEDAIAKLRSTGLDKVIIDEAKKGKPIMGICLGMQLLFENRQFKMVENILSAADIIAEFNPEAYKFIGRVLLNNGYCTQGYEFLQKARDIYYSDPETHYLLAQYYLLINDKNAASKILKKSLSFNPHYFPASNLLESITN